VKKVQDAVVVVSAVSDGGSVVVCSLQHAGEEGVKRVDGSVV